MPGARRRDRIESRACITRNRKTRHRGAKEDMGKRSKIRVSKRHGPEDAEDQRASLAEVRLRRRRRLDPPAHYHCQRDSEHFEHPSGDVHDWRATRGKTKVEKPSSSSAIMLAEHLEDQE